MSARREVNHYTVRSEKIRQSVTFALVSDLHNGPCDDVLPLLEGVDAILMTGDLVNRHREGYDNALTFLKEAPQIAPLYYSIGNHERCFPQRDEYWPHVLKSRAILLDNTYMLAHGVVLGGLSSARKGEEQPGFLSAMAAQEGFKLLLCHHPEYFPRFVKPHDIDLTLSGHAHGGQVRLLGQGVFAPGQGLFPRLTSGWHFDKRLLISRGMINSTWAPRINNPCELIMLHLKGMDDP